MVGLCKSTLQHMACKLCPVKGFPVVPCSFVGSVARFRRATARCESERGHALRLPREHYCRLCAEFPQHPGYSSTWFMHPVCWYFGISYVSRVFAKQVLKACLVNVGLYSVWNTSGSAIWVVLHVVYVCIFIGFMLSYKPAAGKAQSKYMFM